MPHLASNFGLEISTDGYATVTGVIGAIWTVHYIYREESDGFDTFCASELAAPDKKIIELFSFVDYRSPFDDITVYVPDFPDEDEQEQDNCTNLLQMLQDTRKKQRVSPFLADRVKARRDALRRKREQLQRARMDWVNPVINPGILFASCDCSSFTVLGRE